jgi:predicted RNase H-like HicB family nuclease
MTLHYVAVIHRDEGTAYGILFPDFPGCISAGDTLEEALRLGAEALADHVDLMRRDGDAIPAPRALEAIRAEERWIEWKNAFATTVPLLPPPQRAVRINVTIDRHLLGRIDQVTANRSAFLAEAARRALSGGRAKSVGKAAKRSAPSKNRHRRRG